MGIYGKNQNTVKLQLMDPTGTVMEGIYWGEALEFASFIKEHETISITYYPKSIPIMGKRLCKLSYKTIVHIK